MKLSEIQGSMGNIKNFVNEISIAVISNITFEPYFDSLMQSHFVNIDICANVLPISYEEYQLVESKEKMWEVNYIVVCLNFDYLYQNSVIDIAVNRISCSEVFKDLKNRCCELYQYIKQQTQSPIIWLGFEDYCYQYNFVNGRIKLNDNIVDKINNELFILLDKQDTYIDLKRIIADVGIKNAYNTKGKYRWNTPYPKPLISEVCDEIYKQYFIRVGNTKKCIVLDCDNVIWGGVISEDGIDKIVLGSSGLGRAFQDFQRYLLYLYYHGVILTVCSKNYLADVMQVFNKHNEMILKEEHIACFQVNWDNKPGNIIKISELLNIGLDSMSFIDDSEFEIQSVKAILPELIAIKYNRNTIYEQLSCFNLSSNVDVSKVKQRIDTYKTDEQRHELRSNCCTFDEYVDSLEMNIDIHEALSIELNRIAELTQRTNKCTNGKRYTVDQLRELVIEKNYLLFSVSVSDKFSSLGLVGAIGIENNELDLFSLSCRALGRDVEVKMISEVIKHQVTSFLFLSTGKNEKTKELIEQAINSLKII